MFEDMAEKTMREFSAQQQIFGLDQQSTLERMDSSSSLLSSPWFKLANSMEKLMKMRVHTYNTF